MRETAIKVRDNFFEKGIKDYEKGDLESAITKLNTILKIDSNHQEAKLYLGKISMDQKNYKSAKKYYSQVNIIQAMKDVVKKEIDTKLYAQSMIDLAYVCSLDNEKYKHHISKAKFFVGDIGKIQEKKGDYCYDNYDIENAIKFFTCAILIEERPSLYLRRGFAYMESDEHTKAHIDINKVL